MIPQYPPLLSFFEVCRRSVLALGLALLLASAVSAENVQGVSEHDQSLPRPVLGGLESADFDGAALPNAVAAEGRLVRPKGSLFGVQYIMIVNEDGSAIGTITIDASYVDDSAFVIGTGRVMASGFLADDTAPDTVNEGDIGLARMSLSRVVRVTPGDDAGTPVTYGAGTVAATTPRMTLASDDPAVVALQIIDDWDEANRAAVNIIAGQVAISAGGGAVAANTPRVTLASDDPAVASLSVLDDWDEANRAAVNTIAGQVGVQGGAGVVTALTQRVALATDANTIQGTVTANQGTANATPWNENIAQINGVTPLMGGGVTGTGSLRVSLATDANTIQISQTTPATTNGVTLVPTANAGAAIAETASTAAEASNILKASAGNLYSLTITTGATAGFLMIFNATSAPADGAVSPAYCAQVPANNTGAFEWAIPARYSTGITAVFSSTGCFTKTASATAAFFAQVQ